MNGESVSPEINWSAHQDCSHHRIGGHTKEAQESPPKRFYHSAIARSVPALRCYGSQSKSDSALSDKFFDDQICHQKWVKFSLSAHIFRIKWLYLWLCQKIELIGRSFFAVSVSLSLRLCLLFAIYSPITTSVDLFKPITLDSQSDKSHAQRMVDFDGRLSSSMALNSIKQTKHSKRCITGIVGIALLESISMLGLIDRWD